LIVAVALYFLWEKQRAGTAGAGDSAGSLASASPQDAALDPGSSPDISSLIRPTGGGGLAIHPDLRPLFPNTQVNFAQIYNALVANPFGLNISGPRPSNGGKLLVK
jgi:hypothetical protein